MAIVKMRKFRLFAFNKHKEELLEKLQKFEGVQFINLGQEIDGSDLSQIPIDSQEIKTSNLESDQAKVKYALDFLNNYIPKEKGLKAMMKGMKELTYDALVEQAKKTDYLSISDEIKQYETRLSFLKSEIARLRSEIAMLEPWKDLDVPVEQATSFSYANGYLGLIASGQREKFIQELEKNLQTVFIQRVSNTKEGTYLYLIVHKSESSVMDELIKKYGFVNSVFQTSGLCKEHIKVLNDTISEHQKSINEIEASLQTFEDYIPKLEIGYEYLEMEIDRAKCTHNFLKTDYTVIIEGWVTKDDVDDLVNIVNEIAKDESHLEIEEPKEDDDVPIKLKNNAFVRPFESFVSMYGMPNYNGIDPTITIVPFYMLFYGLMLSDAAYGFIQLIGCAFILAKFKLKSSTREMVKLFIFLSVPTIIVGMLYGSYFGGFIKIKPLWMDPSQNVILSLLFAFGVGVIQIFTGLGIKAYMLIRERKYLDALFDVGLWIITLSAAIALAVGMFGNVDALKSPVLLYVLFGGMIGLVLTQGRQNKGIGGKIGGGIYGLYGITGYVGDIVSYSRLMALGLATGFIGSAFNTMIDLLGNGILAWILGPIIFIVGHIFNLLINALGSYVHSLRLQYLEYFGKFYESGGKPFTPFKSKNKYINVIKD